MSAFGVALSSSWIVIRSRTTRSMRSRPIRNGVLDQLAVGADAAVAEVVDVVLGMRGRGCSSMRWPTIAAMSSRVIVRLLARQLDAHAGRRRASSFLLNL